MFVELKLTPPGGLSPMPVMLGVPFAEGALDSPEHVRLLDPSGQETPSQVSVMSRWLGGSVKWVRLEWICPGGGGEKAYRLEFGAGVKRADYPTKLRLRDEAQALEAATGALVLVRGKQTSSPFDRVLSSDGKALAEAGIVRVVDKDGKEWRSAENATESVVVESSGPIRATILCRSLLKRADSPAAYRCDTRVSVFAGLRLVKVNHTFQPVGGPETHELRQVALTLRLAARGGQSITFGGASEPHAVPAGPAYLIAKPDLTYALCVGEKTAVTGERAPGWMAADGLLVAVRDFWQLNQKSLEVSPDGALTIGLWSRHASTTLKMPRTRAVTHEVWLDFDPPLPVKQRAEDILTAKLPVVPPAYFCATRALGDLSPAPSRLCPEYDEKVNAAFARWQEREQKDVHAFGLNHYGDYILYNAYGRAYGYGANEYDAPHALFLQYARTGSPAFLNRAVAAARHMADMDVNHETGQMFFHGYGDGWDDHEHLRAIGGLDHTFGDGLLDYAFITGDPRGWEVALQVADAVQKYVGEGEDMTVCRSLMAGAERSLGWPLLLLVRYYEDTGDPKYLRSARKLADYLHHWATETEEELEKGRWLRTWLQDGCKTFMSSVVGEGLVRYHAVAKDPKATEALTAGIDWLVEKMWYPEYGGFMYEYNAFIPGHRDSFSPEMMTLQMLGYAYKVTKNPKYLRIGLDVLRRGGIGSDGKSFAMPTRNAPHFVAFLDQSGIDPKTAEPETKPPPPDPVKPERLELPGLTVRLTDAALAEAESAVLAEGIEAAVKPKAQASGDKALRVAGKGKGALHWTLRVPQAGDYLLALRYRCDHEKWPVMREAELLIDDAPIPGAANPTRLWYVNRRPTLKSEWDYGVPSTADSMPVPSRLGAGEHKVTLRDPQQVFDLDAVLLIPVTPEQAAELA
ncbi:MAG: hypothetical protein FJ278_05605, partial [Planctomycetes bacterium]|nr:hypothetical protein [Planctomycetota bacterium]